MGDCLIIEDFVKHRYGNQIHERISALKEITKTQFIAQNCHHDEYMRGMANGLIFACSVIDGKGEPVFIERKQDGNN